MTRFVALFLAICLALTSQTMAAARAQPGAVGSMVLCIGGVSATVAVDADGRPLARGHLCPDCALAMLNGPCARAADVPDRVLLGIAAPVVGALGMVPVVVMTPPARGPPVSV